MGQENVKNIATKAQRHKEKMNYEKIKKTFVSSCLSG